MRLVILSFRLLISHSEKIAEAYELLYSSWPIRRRTRQSTQRARAAQRLPLQHIRRWVGATVQARRVKYGRFKSLVKTTLEVDDHDMVHLPVTGLNL